MCHEMEVSNFFIDTNEPIESIYFGGGTPSLLSERELVLLMDTLQKIFSVNEDIEITLEANPDDVTVEQARAWKTAGINRLSLGIQSFADEELRMMHRAHDARQAIDSIRQLQEAGLENISTDLIFGIPHQTDESISDHLKLLKKLNIPHVSCYALTIEEKTILHHQIKKREYPDVNNDQQARQFLLIHDELTSFGYNHYEVSNYCLHGKSSRHNSSYWQGKPYWGFGPSAHAYDGKKTEMECSQ